MILCPVQTEHCAISLTRIDINTSMKQVERPMFGLKSETSGKKISKTIIVVVKAKAVPVKILGIVK